jgi:hypothetical protein
VVDFNKPDPMGDTAPLAGVPGSAMPPLVPPAPVPATAPLPVPPQANPLLVQIGEIRVTQDTVYTPAGAFPVSGSQWYAQDQWTTSEKIPTWAVVCAVVGFCVLTFFSLLFLLAKETVVNGAVAVTVTHGSQSYTAYVPVGHQMQAADIHNRVHYARSLAAR